MHDITDAIVQKLINAACSYELLEHEPVFTMEDVERYIPVPATSRVKTMVVAVQSEVGVEPVLCGLRAASRLDVKKVAALMGVTRSKVSMMPPQAAEEAVGMSRGAIGLIAPFSSPRVFICPFFKEQPFLCFGVGRNDRTLKISADDLTKVIEATFAEIERRTA